jgi:hypothetical protein
MRYVSLLQQPCVAFLTLQLCYQLQSMHFHIVQVFLNRAAAHPVLAKSAEL